MDVSSHYQDRLDPLSHGTRLLKDSLFFRLKFVKTSLLRYNLWIIKRWTVFFQSWAACKKLRDVFYQSRDSKRFPVIEICETTLYLYVEDLF